MSRRITFTLESQALAELEEAMTHSPHPEVRQRATAIRLLHLGHKPEAVSQMLAVAPSTIWNWHRRYRAGRVSALANQAKSGRPSKADETYVQQVTQAIESDPRTVGYEFSVWTINKLRQHLFKVTGVRLSYTRFRALLAKEGYVYRQPKHTPEGLQEAEAKAAGEELLGWLKKTPAKRVPSSSSLWTRRV